MRKIEAKGFSVDGKLLIEQIYDFYDFYESDKPIIDSNEFRKIYKIRRVNLCYFSINQGEISVEKEISVTYDDDGMIIEDTVNSF